jgi:hypothetical protein
MTARTTMSRYRYLLIGFGALLLVVLSGCNQATLMRKMTPKEDEAVARRYVDELRQNKFDQIEQDMAPELKNSNMRPTLVRMAAMFPAQEPTSTKVVGFRAFVGNTRRAEITLEYEFPEKWLLAGVVTQKIRGVTTIAGFHVTPIEDSLENLNRFTLAGKGVSQYAIVTLSVLSLLLSIYVLVLCSKTNIGKRKWLWVIFILFGIGKLGVNWTTGQIFFTLLAIQIPAGGANAQLYGPWLVYASLPLGAIIFLAVVETHAGPVQRLQEGFLDTPTPTTPPPPRVIGAEKPPSHPQS